MEKFENAVIIGRVSSKDQELTGYSLDAQVKLLETYAKGKFNVINTFKIAESATGKQVRKLFQEIFRYVKQNSIKVLLCEKIDRLTRNPKDSLMVCDWLQGDEARSVHFVKENFVVNKNTKAHENLIWDVKVAIARFYSSNLSEEVKKGRKEKLAQGWIPGMPKRGYKSIGESGHRTHIINEDEAVYIRKMFDLYVTGGYSLKSLMYTLYDAGFRTRKKHPVSISNLHRLLTDPFYYGVIRWEGKLYQGEHLPLITKETFDKVQSILKGKTTPKVGRHYYLFKALFRCANCHGLITWERHKGIVYGHCNYRYYKNCGKKKWAIESETEKELLGYFDRLEIKDKRVADWLLKALRESHSEEITYFTTTQDKLQVELMRYQKILDNLYEDKLDGVITKERYELKFAEFSARKNQVAEAIEKHSKQGSEYFKLASGLYELGQSGRKIYKKASPEEKQQLLRLVFSELKLDGEFVQVEYSEPFRLLATAVKNTNESSKSSEKLFDLKFNNIFFELKISLTNKSKSTTLSDAFPSWLGSWDSNPGPIG